jgi:hypothetical protein
VYRFYLGGPSVGTRVPGGGQRCVRRSAWKWNEWKWNQWKWNEPPDRLAASARALPRPAVYVGLLGVDFTARWPPDLRARLRERAARHERANR